MITDFMRSSLLPRETLVAGLRKCSAMHPVQSSIGSNDLKNVVFQDLWTVNVPDVPHG